MRVTSTSAGQGKPTDNTFTESSSGKLSTERLDANGSRASTKRGQDARLGVETTMRCATQRDGNRASRTSEELFSMRQRRGRSWAQSDEHLTFKREPDQEVSDAVKDHA
jgi:hypothetical protein